jgi:hypothetical protein
MRGLSSKNAAKNPYRGGSKPLLTGCGKGRCPAGIRIKKALHYEKNKEAYIARAASRPSEEVTAYKRAWKSRNKGLVAEQVSARKKHVRRATPSWLTKEQKGRIKEFYVEAEKLKRETGVDYEVDHIIPVRGELVSGLHVPWNLRVITAEENQKKNRKLLDDTEAY